MTEIAQEVKVKYIHLFILNLISAYVASEVLTSSLASWWLGIFTGVFGLLLIITIELNARDFTAQSRRRQIVVGCSKLETASRFKRCVFDASDGEGACPPSTGKEAAFAASLTAHPARMAAEDSYCYEGGRLRALLPEEREALQGFPRGWTSGFSRSRRAIMTGNAIPVPFAEWIGKRILEAAC